MLFTGYRCVAWSRRLLAVEETDDDHGGEEVDEGGPEHHVERAVGLLVEGDAAPGRLRQLHLVVRQVVHLYYKHVPQRCEQSISKKFTIFEGIYKIGLLCLDAHLAIK